MAKRKRRELSDESKEEIKIICYLLFRLAIIAAIVILIKEIIDTYKPVDLEIYGYDPIFIEEVVTEEQMAKNQGM